MEYMTTEMEANYENTRSSALSEYAEDQKRAMAAKQERILKRRLQATMIKRNANRRKNKAARKSRRLHRG